MRDNGVYVAYTVQICSKDLLIFTETMCSNEICISGA